MAGQHNFVLPTDRRIFLHMEISNCPVPLFENLDARFLKIQPKYNQTLAFLQNSIYNTYADIYSL